MARFHVRKRDGALVDGGAAFAELWTQLPSMKLFGMIFTKPPFRAVINAAYDLFLPFRPHMQRLIRSRAER